jgi:NAD(P)-dependent dehydrogenase (short-subunit alcohol dehydrogenase family)
VVTGAGSGIGKAIASSLADEGARVALLARTSETLAAAVAVITEAGGSAMAVVADTTVPESVAHAVATVVETWGGIDILVNAAARPSTSAARGATLSTFDEDAFLDDINTKVLGYLRMIRSVVPYMTAAGWGRIINISGRNALVTGSTSGSVRNVAVAALSKNLADELGPHGITVTTVHPGLTRTAAVEEDLEAKAHSLGVAKSEVVSELAARNSLQRLIAPVEVAHLVTFLASPLSSAINGAAIEAGGGLRGFINY